MRSDTDDAAYGLLTDLSALSEIAGETSAISWHSGSSAAPDAVFRGTNRNGWRRWTTTCTVTESMWDRRPGWVKGPGRYVTGIQDRIGTNTANIAATLARLKARAEA
jgi:hypothetical protein